MNNSTWKELILTLLALAAAAVAPNILVVSAAGYSSMPVLFKYLFVPAQIVIAVLTVYAYVTRMNRLFNRLWVGIVAGIALSIALDIVRLTGFHLGYMSGNMPRMFGVMILDRMAEGPTPWSDFVGYFYHFVNGISFGLTYTLIFGRTRWWGGVLFADLFVEVGMMTLPPMIYMTGPFGLGLGKGLLNGVFITSLIAHTAMGAVLGVVQARYVKHPESILALFRFSVGQAKQPWFRAV